MIIAGIEEAGRGCVIGPMVMCIAVIDDNLIEDLLIYGVKDSKQLTPKRRTEIFEKLIQSLDYEICIISPDEIDKCLESQYTNLNWLEAEVSAKLAKKMLKRCNIDKIIIDCPSNNTDAYKEFFLNLLDKKIDVIAEHKADVNYPIVSAASIIAKVIRDREIENIKKILDVPLGSGYTSDPLTIKFLKEYYLRNKSFPNFVRKSWKTINRIIKEIEQKKIIDFF